MHSFSIFSFVSILILAIHCSNDDSNTLEPKSGKRLYDCPCSTCGKRSRTKCHSSLTAITATLSASNTTSTTADSNTASSATVSSVTPSASTSTTIAQSTSVNSTTGQPQKPVQSSSSSPPSTGSSLAGPFKGTATFYTEWSGAGAMGSCGIPLPSAPSLKGMIAAVSASSYQTSWCGKCAKVKQASGGGKEIVVMLWDKCPGCGANGLDLSDTAFLALQTPKGKDDGRVEIEWSVIDCPNS